ncbi:MAG: LPS assembly protein LptD [Terrimicrobiaceae bacterium]|nr:LPS assembly protein LptD [Terrimicrobiaceae bacterium]
MRKSLWWIPIFALLLPVSGRAQFGNFGDVPVDITTDPVQGETRFENGVAIAENGVQIHYQDVSIYSDYAEYNPDTREVLLIGDVRIYSKDNVFTGQRALYNLESKQIRALEFKGQYTPLKFRAMSIQAPSLHQFNVRNAELTTDDSSEPSFHIRARSVRIYPDDRVIFSNSTLYIGQLPVFWFPYLFAFTNNTGFELRPGYESTWGYFLLTGYNFPVGSGGNIIATAKSDYRTKLGYAIGLDAKWQFGKDDRSYGLLKTYYAYDTDPNYLLSPGHLAAPDDHDRYRVTFQDRLFLTDDIFFTADLNKLSDFSFLQDYFPAEFTNDPQPDNYLSLTKWDEFYTLTLLTRFQMNDFFETTERLPELVLNFKQHRLFDSPIYYDGQNSVGYLRRAFPDGSIFPNYDATRFDTFHQFSYPRTYFGWLSIIPKVGLRGTYYSKTGHTIGVLSDQQLAQINHDRALAQNNRAAAQQTAAMISDLQNQLNSTTDPVSQAQLQSKIEALSNSEQNRLAAAQAQEALANSIESGTLKGAALDSGGSTFRPIVNFGLEASFKLSRKYEWVQSRALGLDGVLHTVQPYVNYSYVYNAGLARNDILQFDRVVPATEPLPLDFPQFVAIDSIDSWNIVRLGIRNRLTTRRGDDNWEWFLLDSFFDVDLQNPYVDNGNGTVTNVVNRLQFRPVNWATLTMDAQLPVTDQGFTDVNTSILFMPWKDVLLQFGDRYLENNPFFANSNQITGYAYYQITSNWGVSAQATYEVETDQLLFQRYLIHRDLSSWIVSFGGEVRQNKGNTNTNLNGSNNNYGVILSLTLKDAPQVTLPLAYDQATSPLGGPSGPSSN